ncbi:phosphate/phosphite/phosphonate ABC transporter substrate-binding protein [Wenxinia marina]|uniref:ABC-type phosphate/phosphonate transport system, periplasmic component n=1 Tax=Wenxinia marina DSM 24838 TaxID=1123501 RepID=A0A0D0QBC9_9RHOB|nr:PhnD/SsuA/transferrin family substrate-binding protein [Wenxinia marina]KIQ68198.1 ABC-type phosphate/phosphonate transport system, periplasmic component [Wenxinia marina DSM 24838]GGL76684.1 phosphate ABC transporter substrate-binding protein [Wenxinia marina]
MFAALPMYDRPETAAAHDALWTGIRDRLRSDGIDAPASLDRETDHMAGWARDDLLLGQICNLPLRVLHRRRLTVLGCGDYGLDGTAPGLYRSLFVVRDDHPARRPEDAVHEPFAYNDALSWSGWGAPWHWADANGLFLTPALATGAHTASARAVADGRAGLAAIDAITWRALQRWEPAAARLRVIGRTGASPGQSFVTARPEHADAIRAALAAAIAGLPSEHAATLGLRGIVRLPDTAYDLAVPPDPQAIAA